MNKVNLNGFVHNRFDIINKHIDGTQDEMTAFNLVLDQYFTWLCTNGASHVGQYLHIGDSTVAPVKTDTKLTSFKLSVSPSESTRGKVDYRIGYMRRKFTISPEAYTGNIAELGLARGTAQGDLITKALLKDSNGNAITMAKTATDIVDIYSTFYFVLPESTSALYVSDVSINFLADYVLSGTTSAFTSDYNANYAFSAQCGDSLVSQYGVVGPIAWTWGGAAKTISTNVSRLPATSLNTEIDAILLGYRWMNGYENGQTVLYNTISASFMMRNANHAVIPVTDVRIGTGDGVKDTFVLPHRFIDESVDITIKNNGVTAPNTLSK